VQKKVTDFGCPRPCRFRKYQKFDTNLKRDFLSSGLYTPQVIRKK
jgi:hypothetical protein